MDLKKTIFNRIFQVDVFEKEFFKTFKIPQSQKQLPLFTSNGETDCKDKYVKWLVATLFKLSYCVDGDMRLPEFEYIETYNGGKIYSIRNTKLPKNPRILYIYYSEKDIIILLCAFAEQHDHAYDHYKQVARQRINMLLEE